MHPEARQTLERLAILRSTYTFRLSQFLKSGDFSIYLFRGFPESAFRLFERNHFRGIYSNASQIISLNFTQRAYATSSQSLFHRLRNHFQIFVRPELVAGKDLNLRPSGYEPDELPDCSTRACGFCFSNSNN